MQSEKHYGLDVTAILNILGVHLEDARKQIKCSEFFKIKGKRVIETFLVGLMSCLFIRFLSALVFRHNFGLLIRHSENIDVP